MTEKNFILLADDDIDDQEFIQLAFAKVTSVHHIEIVSNGQELLKALKQHSNTPCLIILDLNMPVLNGFQTLIALSHEPRYKSVPKIVLTTSDNDENKKRSLSQGATDYFVKPSNMKDLVLTAEKILAYCH